MTPALNGYVCFWSGKTCEVYAESSIAGRDKAVTAFKAMAGRRKVKDHDVSVMLAHPD
jgi:hypothetical protein